jgi:heparin/heparan-sulfate lyase
MFKSKLNNPFKRLLTIALTVAMLLSTTVISSPKANAAETVNTPNPVVTYPPLTERDIPKSLPAVPSEHPRVYISSRNIDYYKAKLEEPSMKTINDKLIASANVIIDGKLDEALEENYNSGIKNNIEAKALMYVLTGDNTMGQNAVDAMMNFNRSVRIKPSNGLRYRHFGNIISANAMVYDWCYSLLTEAQKSEFIAWIETFAQQMECGWPEIIQNSTVGHGAEYQIQQHLVAAGLAVYDEKPAIYQRAAGRVLKEFAEVRDFWSKGNFQPMGSSYGGYRYASEISAVYLFDAIGVPNVYGPDHKYSMYHNIYTRRPDGMVFQDADDYSLYSSFGPQERNSALALEWAGSYYKDGVQIGEFIKQSNTFGAGGDGAADYIYDFLFYDPLVKPTIPQVAQLPLARYFPDPLGGIVARTRWSGGLSSNTAVVTMDMSTYHFNGHDHLDSGNFQIYYKGPLTVDSGIYQGKNGSYGCAHDLNYYKRSIAHNVMLVNDPAETFKWWDSDVANDGGQRWNNDGKEPDNLGSIEDSSNGYKAGSVLAQSIGPNAGNPEYTYLKGDLKDAYSSKVSSYSRSMVYLNLFDDMHPIALLVYDKIASSNKDFKKSWLLHTVDEPSINGNVTTAIAPKARGYNGKLVNTTLLPATENLLINKVGGTDNQYNVGGTNYPQTIDNIGKYQDDNAAWRIEVSPKTPETENTFLNVMQAMDDVGGPSNLEVTSIDSPKYTGAQIADRVVLFSKSGDVVGDEITFDVTGEGTFKFLVADVKDGYWAVSRNGEEAKMQYQVTEEAGSLYFYGEAGSYKLTYSATKTLGDPPAFPEPPQVDETFTPSTKINKVSKENNSVTVEYDQVTSADRYIIYYGTESGNYTNQVVTTSTSAKIDGLINGTTYYFAVACESLLGLSAYSNEMSQTPHEPNAITPVDFNVIADGLKATFIFTPDSINTGYMVKYGTGASGVYTSTIEDVKNGDRITLPESAKPYNFIIVPYNDNGLGTPSNEVKVLLDISYLRIENVVASNPPQEGYLPVNTIDENFGTCWVGENEQWLQYDLGTEKEVGAVAIAYGNAYRKPFFDIEVSSDGTSWTNVYKDGVVNFDTKELITFKFNAATARYVRILCHGHSVNGYGLGWNNITEVRIFGANPTKPTGLTAVSKTKDSVSLKWNGSTSISGSAISYDLYQGERKVNTSAINDTAYTVTGLAAGTSYIFTIVAKDSEGRVSVSSNPLNVATDSEAPVVIPPPATPTPTPAPTPTPTPTPKPVTDEIEVTAELQGKAALAKVDADTLTKAFDSAAKDSQGDKVVTLEIKYTQDAKEYMLELPKDVFKPDEKDSEKKIEIKTPVGTVTVSDNMFKAKDLQGSSDVTISIASTDISETNAELKKKIGNRPVIELNAMVDGKVINWRNNKAPVTVTIEYAPTAEELKNPEHIVVWYIDGQGKVNMVPTGKYDAATGKVTFTTTHFSQYTVAFEVKTFKDINSIAWAKKEIEVLASKGVISGTSESTFSPDANITRADFIKLLVGALGISADIESNFDDVKTTDYYYEAVGIAKRLGITEGTGNNKFNPKGYITRQEMMALIAKAIRITGKNLSNSISVDLTNFKDSSAIADYAREAITLLMRDGMVIGNGDTINPAGNATRAQVAVLLYKLYNK